MANIIIECAKYLMVILIVIYTFTCFSVFGYDDVEKKSRVLVQQSLLVFIIHFVAFAGMFFKTIDVKLLLLYGAQALLLGGIIFAYSKIYPRVSRLVVNNMCMLLTIGFIMLSRLSYEKSVKQCVISAGAFVVSLLVPIFVCKVKHLSKLTLLYGIIGIGALLAVFILGRVSYGAKLGITIAGISLQPSELVKILFVFFVAASLKKCLHFRRVLFTTAVAAFHVLILVISKDLGAALIIFVVYLVMLYVATKNPLYSLAGLVGGSGAAVVAYQLFSHVRVRVQVWKDPFAVYETGGYQVAQSLFAIGTGGWFGAGLFQGEADMIPVADEDFIFSAIAEELGLVFALCLILICLSCYVMFLNIAMQLKNQFYKLVALGLGTCYIFQTFLTIGGVTKFIPSTGVTLPLVSYGGSSVLSTLIMFAIIQGLYLLRENEEADIERAKNEKKRTRYHSRTVRGASSSGRTSGQRRTEKKKA